MSLSATPHIAFVLGKPPERSPVLPEVIARLRAVAALRVAVPDATHPLDPGAAWLRHADVVAVRGLGEGALAALAVAEQSGVRCCNRIAATLAVRDRAQVCRLLAEHGVPVPDTVTVAAWADALRRAGGRPAVVKAADAARGRGAGVVIAADGELPTNPPFDGPYLVQDYVAGDGVDRKLYVIGWRVAGLLKRWPRAPDAPRGGVPFDVSDEHADLARRAGASLGLEIYGVDVVEGAAGPAVVDVNPFPSCAGVLGAAAAIADHLLAIAR